jgi:von Willebrand factor type A domain
MLNIQFMDPHVLWVWVPITLVLGGAFAWYNLRTLSGARELWGDHVFLKQFSPRNTVQNLSLWTQWLAFLQVLVIALAGPHLSTAPDMVPAGAVQVEFVYDVSPSMVAEDYRGFLPAPDGGIIPDKGFQWGTRLDAAKFYTNQLLPQLKGNEVGLTTLMGEGFNMWDLTTDLSPKGAFNVMLQKFVQQGAAPGGGSDYTKGLNVALAEFDLMTEVHKRLGVSDDRVRFIVLFTDGGFTGDQAELTKALAEVNKRGVRLLIVAVGGKAAVTVPKYDATSKRRNGEFYDGTTQVDLSVLTGMRDAVPGSDLIPVPPGTEHLDYSFPQKAGGLHATPTQSNLRPWLLFIDLLLLFTITTGGGGLPRWRLLVPVIRVSTIKTAIDSLKSRSGKRTS